MNWSAYEAIALVIMAAIEAITIFLALRERRAKKKAEDELNQIHRRGTAPYFRPSEEIVSNLWINTSTGGIACIPSIHPAVLRKSRNEVRIDDSESVFLVVENLGEAAHVISVKLDNETISLDQEPDMDSAHGFQYFVYPYQKAKHGKEQRVSLAFETRSGVQDTHLYVTRHGCRFLQRVDPPLPH